MDEAEYQIELALHLQEPSNPTKGNHKLYYKKETLEIRKSGRKWKPLHTCNNNKMSDDFSVSERIIENLPQLSYMHKFNLWKKIKNSIIHCFDEMSTKGRSKRRDSLSREKRGKICSKPMPNLAFLRPIFPNKL